MDRMIGSGYPQHVAQLGQIEFYTQYVDLHNVDGIYLRYLLAAVSKKNKSVNLIFGPALMPQTLRVFTFDNKEFQNWELDNYNKEDFKKACEKLGLNPMDTSLEEFAKKLLLSVAPSNIVPVPAYKFIS